MTSLDGITTQFHHMSNSQSTKLALDLGRHCIPAFVLYLAPTFIDQGLTLGAACEPSAYGHVMFDQLRFVAWDQAPSRDPIRNQLA